jgi:hypothetical protein
MSTRFVILTAVANLAGFAWGGYQLWPRKLEWRPTPLIPSWQRVANKDVVSLRGRFPVVEIARYDDEFFAFLMFRYLQGSSAFRGAEVLLTYSGSAGRMAYPLELALPNDLISATWLLSEAKVHGLSTDASWRYATAEVLDRFRYQTNLFLTAYSLPTRLKLEDLSRAQLIGYIRRFVRFKSLTDPRVRRGIAPIPQPLSSKEALQLAEDIVAVAHFYSLPLDFFLGIGAMENNYMNVEGDLKHTRWKRRAAHGDVVLDRRKGKVLVVNSSLGVWQITRETLRYAHDLYGKDRRDYSLLPSRLRPPTELDVHNVDPAVLTTYAGLFFRNLLDRCHGDTGLAVGAYNGGLGKPNPHYAEGVQLVAEYARRMMEHAAVLNGPAAGMRFITASRRPLVSCCRP